MHTSRLIGKEGRVVSQVSGDSGQIEVEGELWEARSIDSATMFPVAANVRIKSNRKTVLMVTEAGN